MTKHVQTLMMSVVGAAMLVGCATTTTAPKVIQPLALNATSKPNITDISIDVAKGVWITDPNRDTIRDKIWSNLTEHGYRLPGVTPAFHMMVSITRFDEGNAAARLALIGLGQIHIEGTVTILDADSKNVGEYKITKAFAAGGLVGGLTTTENVEDGFAKSVVAALGPRS